MALSLATCICSWLAPTDFRSASQTTFRSAGLVPGTSTTSWHGSRPLNARVPPERSGGVRVGLAHGTVEGILPDEPEYPIPRDAPALHGLDYLALGHWHSATPFPDTGGVQHMAYSGTHETAKFGERDSGNALLVEIAGPGAPPAITTLRTGGLRWEVLVRELAAPGELRDLRVSIESLEDPGLTLLDLHLGGLLFADDQAELARIRELIAARYIFGRVDVAALRPAPSDARWIESLPEGILRDTALRLREFADPSYVGQRPEGASPAVSAQALLELCSLASEVCG